MMAVLVSSGALLLVLLTGASYSYPAKKAFDSSSSYSGNYGANPGSGSNWEAPGFEVASQTAPNGGPYYQPNVQREPASYSSNAFAGPVPSGSASSSSAGSVQPSSFLPALSQDVAWAVAPPGPSSETSPLGPSYVSPPEPIPYPEFQAGELSHVENTFEHGNYESETEDQGFQAPPPGVEVSASEGFTSEPQPSGLGRGFVVYPYDYMFLTGQYPPGTYTHSSSSFEQGRDHWQDTHYIRDYVPSSPNTQQVKTFPSDVKAPQSIKQPSQPTQNFGGLRYGQGGATTGQAQPYGVGLQGSSQPGRFVPPHLSSPGGRYGGRKI